MDSVWWKVLAFLLSAVLLFLVPLMNILERQIDIAYNVVFAECNRFADACRDTGYITPNMFKEFTDRINSTGNTYDIKLSHVHRTVNPVYRQEGTSLIFTGRYEVNHIAVDETEIMGVLFPENSPLSVLDPARRYEMSMGDLFFVEVKNRGKTMAAALRGMILFIDSESPDIFVRAGGMVRNEAY